MKRSGKWQKRWWGLKRNAELVFFLSLATLRTEVARTIAGFLWWFIDPLLSIGVYYLAFGFLFRARAENYAIFLSIGIVAWRWLSGTLNSGCWSIRANESLLKQVRVHNLVYPSIVILTSTLKHLLTLVLLIVIVVVSGSPPTWAYLSLPVIVIVEFLFICGSVYCLAGVVTFFPDLRWIIPNLLHLLFFVSGIIFRVERIPGRVSMVLSYNPISMLISGHRAILLDGTHPDYGDLGYVAAISVALIVIGCCLIHRFDRNYVKFV